jgi:hypothetical protein
VFRVRLLVLAVPVAVTVLAGSALAYVCHPLSAGERMLTLKGAVRSVAVHGPHVDFLVARGGRCYRIAWNTASGGQGSGPARSCAARSTQSLGRSVPVSADSRGRPVLRVGAREVPLPAFARDATAYHGIAIVETTHPDGGLFAVRLRDGAFTFLAPDGRGFTPRVDGRGVVLHDGESKRAVRAGKTVALFVPRRALARGFAKTTAPLRVTAIRGFAMDGLRVALTVADPAARCDRVLYWNVAWRPVQRISAPLGPTCLPSGRTQLGAVAVGGFRAEWLARTRGKVRLIAGSPLCQEWVVHRFGAERLAALAADGSTIAYATAGPNSSSVGLVAGNWRARHIATSSSTPVALAVDRTRVAIVWADGTAELRTISGARLGLLHVGAARAVALDGTKLAVLRGSRLAVYDLAGRRLLGSFAVRGARGLDLQSGVAAFARGREAVVLDTVTGRTAVVGRAPKALLGVQIEGPGLAFAWTTARSGVARFVTTAQLERALR